MRQHRAFRTYSQESRKTEEKMVVEAVSVVPVLPRLPCFSGKIQGKFMIFGIPTIKEHKRSTRNKDKIDSCR